MTLQKFLAAIVAAAMCLSLGVTAFAVGEEESTTEAVTEEITTEEATSEEASTEENVTDEPSSEDTSEEETSEEATSEEISTEEPGEEDVIALIIKLLGQIDFEEVKDTLNDINEALGLPRVENFTDIPAYADAIYEKLDEMGLGYDDIINGITSSDLLDWLNSLIFGGGSSTAPTTTAVSDEDDLFGDDFNDSGESTPDTGIAVGGAIAAFATLGGSGALAYVLRKRNDDEE